MNSQKEENEKQAKQDRILSKLRLSDSPDPSIEVQDVIDMFEVSPPTAYKIINSMINDHCLHKENKKIKLLSSFYSLIGLSIGTTICKISFVNFNFDRFNKADFSLHKIELISRINNIICNIYKKEADELLIECKKSEKHNYIFFKTPDNIELLKAIIDTLLDYIIDAINNEQLHVLCIGIACTGTINYQTQTIEDSHSLKWLQFRGIDTLLLPDKVSFCNNNNIHISLVQNSVASVIAEKVDLYKRNDIPKIHKNDQNIAALYLEFGINVGIYLDKLYCGKGYTGEAGHLPSPPIEMEDKYKILTQNTSTNDHCTCGNSDCYEFKIRKYCFNDFYITTGTDDNKIKIPKDFKDASASEIEEFLQNEPLKADLLGEYIGSMINMLTGLLDVNCIILTGKLYKSKEEIQNAIDIGQDRSRLVHSRRNCPIIYSRYGSSAPSIGAALYAYKEKYKLDFKWDIE